MKAPVAHPSSPLWLSSSPVPLVKSKVETSPAMAVELEALFKMRAHWRSASMTELQ